MEKHTLLLLIILMLNFFLNVWGITWGLPNNISWSPDDISPYGPLSFLYQRFCAKYVYPPAQYVLTSLLYGLYLIYVHSAYKIDSITSDNMFMSNLMLISRIVSAVMGTVIVYVVYSTSRKIYKNYSAAIFSSAIIAFTYIFVEFSHLGNVDIPYMFWFSLSFYSFLCVLENHKSRDYALLGIFSALSSSTKDLILGAYIGVFIIFIYLSVRGYDLKKYSSKIQLINLSLLIVSFIFTYSTINLLPFCPTHFLYRFLRLSDPSIYWLHLPYGQFTFFVAVVHNILSCVGLPLFLILIGGLLHSALKSKERTLIFLVPILSYYLFPLALVRYHQYRYMLPIVYLLAFPGGDFLRRISETTIRGNYVITKILITVILLYSFLYASINDVLMSNDTRYLAEKWVSGNVLPGQKIAFIGRPEYAGRLGYPNHNFSVYYNISVENADEILGSDYIVLNSFTSYSICNSNQCNSYFKDIVDNLMNGSVGYDIVADFDVSDTVSPYFIKFFYPLTLYDRSMENNILKPFGAGIYTIPNDRVSPRVILLKKRSGISM